jgi:hypothetical protein
MSVESLYCSICLDSILDRSYSVHELERSDQSKIYHTFHAHCLTIALNLRNECPICRDDFERKEISNRDYSLIKKLIYEIQTTFHTVTLEIQQSQVERKVQILQAAIIVFALALYSHVTNAKEKGNNTDEGINTGFLPTVVGFLIKNFRHPVVVDTIDDLIGTITACAASIFTLPSTVSENVSVFVCVALITGIFYRTFRPCDRLPYPALGTIAVAGYNIASHFVHPVALQMTMGIIILTTVLRRLTE